MSLLRPSELDFRVFFGENWKLIKVFWTVLVGPLIRRGLAIFLIKILGTIPRKCFLPVFLDNVWNKGSTTVFRQLPVLTGNAWATQSLSEESTISVQRKSGTGTRDPGDPCPGCRPLQSTSLTNKNPLQISQFFSDCIQNSRSFNLPFQFAGFIALY